MDPHIPTALLVLLTAFLVLLNGFFVATEYAIVQVRGARIKELAENGNPAANAAAEIAAHLNAYLSATQLGITLTSLGLGWIGGPVIAERMIKPLFAFAHLDVSAPLVMWAAVALAFLAITSIQIIFGIQAPRWLAIQRAEQTSVRTARPMRLFFLLFQPLILGLNLAAKGVARLFGIQTMDAREMAHSEDELRLLITASSDDRGGTLHEMQAELLDNVFDFAHLLARQVMVHRTDMLVLDAEDTPEEIVRRAQEGGHTRYPVIEGDIDSIIGFCHTKDLYTLFQREPQGDIRTILRTVMLVPETNRVDLLLRQLQRARQHIAVLVDEYGGTAGMVTIFDLLEELVGDLPDEFEPAEDEWVIRLDAHAFSIDGRLPLTDLEEVLDCELPCEEAGDTVGGYAFWAFGRIPEAGDLVVKDGITLRILAMDGRRVSRVEITVAPDHTEERAAAAHAGHGR